jgi:PKD repeat protein
LKLLARRLAWRRNRTGDAAPPDRGLRRAVPGLSQRGQSLTELALILPLILLLTVAALDFGRIYLGYINVQNMARIAANYAANNPLAWGTAPDEDIQARYQSQVLEDSKANNCELPVVGGKSVVPDPTFTDVNLDGTATGLGDTVTVAINCDFAVITPMIGNILGGTVEVTAASNFPVKAGMTSVAASGPGSGGGGGVATPPSAAFEAGGVFSTDEPPWLWLTGPAVTVDFRDASGGGPATSWLWSFDDGTTATTRDAAHEFNCTVPDFYGFCSYLVSLKATNAAGHTTAYMGVLVEATSSVDFSVSPAVVSRGQTVTFTDASTAGGTNFRWDFGDGQTESGPGGTVTHAFAAAGTYSVRLWVTYPDPIDELGPASKTVTVNPGYCTVPSLTNVMFDKANETWQGAYHFTGTVERASGAPAPPKNFKITAQSIAAGNGATALCSSNIYVSSP